jgi:hygromycin-B 4-O-kinase
MDVFKPIIEQDELEALLARHFSAPVSALAPITDGHMARVFSFRNGERDYVIRFVPLKWSSGLRKEAYCYQQFGSPRILIPPIVASGEQADLYYAISPKVTGTTLDKLPSAEFEALLPAVIATLDTIHQVDVRDQTGYGFFTETGAGMWESWRGFLTNIKDEEPETRFYGKWHRLFEETFLEREMWFALYDEMVRLLAFCPEERFLLHGDYGFNNVLAQDGAITAVLDWGDAKYGDFLYEVAGLILMSPEIDYLKHFTNYYADQGREVPHLRERLRCYAIHSGLDGLRFFAKQGDQTAYEWVLKRINEVLA